MRVEKVRIQNFQCIRDSGDISLDDNITVLVGENESGKSAILKALSYFNQGESFETIDVSTMSADIRQRLDSGELSRDSVEMVSIWVKLSDKDKRSLALPEWVGSISLLKIVKMLDNQYKVYTDDGEPLSKSLLKKPNKELVAYLEELQKKVMNVYCGQIKRKKFTDEFVFLQRYEGEPDNENLILFIEKAGPIWDSLQEGDWVQVTKIAIDPFEKSSRALNAGLKFDLNKLISDFASNIQTDEGNVTQAYETFKFRLEDLPFDHPLRDDYITNDVLDEIEALSTISKVEFNPGDIELKIINSMPQFVYLPTIEKISDSIALSNLRLEPNTLGESDVILAALIKIAGLRPDIVLTKEPAERMQILKEKSNNISRCLSEYWFKDDLQIDFDFLKQDEVIGIAVESAGSYDPPSRRSHGCSSYLSLFAKLSYLGVKEDIVVLLDDPAMHFHPVAQRTIIKFLESQQYQIVLATHLPFMINPERLERIRIVKRTPAGSQIEHDWSKAAQNLLPVWGSLMGSFIGKIWLLVEGKSDKEYFEILSRACKVSNYEHLSDEFMIVPGGGSQLPFVAKALSERGIFFVAILDGDKAGAEIKKLMIDLCNIKPERIVTLDGVGLSEEPNPRTEDLFSQAFKTIHNVRDRGLPQAVIAVDTGKGAFDDTTLSSFAKVFSSINKAIK